MPPHLALLWRLFNPATALAILSSGSIFQDYKITPKQLAFNMSLAVSDIL
jgi:hypothetical protein